MKEFARIIELLNARFPGVFSCRPGQHGRARGLEVRCAGRPGYAFVYEPSQVSLLLALHERDEDTHPEVWNETGPEQVVRRVLPWAFSRRWTAPEPVNRKAEKRRLEKIAGGLSERGRVSCQIAEMDEKLMSLLTPEGQRTLEEDRKILSSRRLVRHFPWDSRGRLSLKTTVLLKPYEMVKPPGRGRDVCLAVRGPERRQEEPRIRVELADLIVVNQTHRWESSPWLWTDVEVPHSELWGAETHLDPAHGGVVEGRLPVDTSESRHAALSVQLLDEGRIEEALSLYQVTLSEDLHRILGGERISPPACCAHPDEIWTNSLVSTLRQSAPWLFPKAVRDEAERLANWADRKRGRHRGAPSLKLMIFPGQFHSRKASLMLIGDRDGENPRLVIEATASNARLHDTAWKRPIAVDFLRLGVKYHPFGQPIDRGE